MKALAIETSVPRITISARNGEMTATISLDIGMHQSERLIPTIDYVTKECALNTSELDFIALSKGPGSFTGLRLGFAAAKAIQLVAGCPVYGISTLKAYAHPFRNWNGNVITAIDAKKERFYASMYKGEETIREESDVSPDEIGLWIESSRNSPVLLAGPDAKILHERLKGLGITENVFIFDELHYDVTEPLFLLGQKLLEENQEGMADYDGPVYIRKSEAEEKSQA